MGVRGAVPLGGDRALHHAVFRVGRHRAARDRVAALRLGRPRGLPVARCLRVAAPLPAGVPHRLAVAPLVALRGALPSGAGRRRRRAAGGPAGADRQLRVGPGRAPGLASELHLRAQVGPLPDQDLLLDLRLLLPHSERVHPHGRCATTVGSRALGRCLVVGHTFWHRDDQRWCFEATAHQAERDQCRRRNAECVTDRHVGGWTWRRPALRGLRPQMARLAACGLRVFVFLKLHGHRRQEQNARAPGKDLPAPEGVHRRRWREDGPTEVARFRRRDLFWDKWHMP
mmetsp:Transcript_38832/g.117293  ORF Transcript_38832/g.117293 Transcript_38832/m.117293 type:complete len:285 (+) Transcript_38832:929-1783(+)